MSLSLLFTLSIILLIVLPFVALMWLSWMGYQTRRETIALIEPVLFKWGFKRASLLEYMTEQFLYKNTQNRHPVFISLKGLNSGPNSGTQTFLVIQLQIPVDGDFFLCVQGMDTEENDLLYDQDFWPRKISDILTPFGLRLLCSPSNQAQLEQRLLQAKSILSSWVAQRQRFFLFGFKTGCLQIGFALQERFDQQIQSWLESAAQLGRLLYSPARIGAAKRINIRRTILQILIFLFLMLFMVWYMFSSGLIAGA